MLSRQRFQIHTVERKFTVVVVEEELPLLDHQCTQASPKPRCLGCSNEVDRHGKVAGVERRSLGRINDARLGRCDGHCLVGGDEDAAQGVLASDVGRGSLALGRHGRSRHVCSALLYRAGDGVRLV